MLGSSLIGFLISLRSPLKGLVGLVLAAGVYCLLRQSAIFLGSWTSFPLKEIL